MGVQTTAGSILHIGTTAANAATDTYTEIGEVINIGEYGRTYNMITYNPLKTRATQKFKGSYNDGDPVVSLGKDINDAGQAAVIVALNKDWDYNFKVLDNDDVPPESFAVTISVASPGVLTKVAHGLAVNTAITLATTISLPTGLVVGTTYYVKTVLDADTFTLSATLSGTAINTTVAGSGTHTMTTVPVGSYQTFKAKVGSFVDAPRAGDSIISKNMLLAIKSDSLFETVHLP